MTNPSSLSRPETCVVCNSVRRVGVSRVNVSLEWMSFFHKGPVIMFRDPRL